MSNKKVVFIILLTTIIFVSLVFAQIPSPLKGVKVSATVNLDSTSGIYTYGYTIYNPAINNGQIFDLQIDISKPLQSQELSAEGLVIQIGVDYQGIMLTRSFEEEITRLGFLLQKPVIPIGTQVPSDWIGGIAVMGTVMWGSSEKSLILPGNTLDGFMISTRGLPTIREAELMPAIDYDNLPDEYYGNVELTKQLQDSLIYSTKTIAPTAPPADFKPIEFLDYIISLKHEASSLAWITNKGIENSLDKKLDNARKKLEQGNTTAAKNILNAFLKEVEVQGCKSPDKCPKGKHLTPEAYGLLKYNVEYLIDNLTK